MKSQKPSDKNLTKISLIILGVLISTLTYIIIYYFIFARGQYNTIQPAYLDRVRQNEYKFYNRNSANFSFELPDEFEVDSVDLVTGLELYLKSTEGYETEIENRAPDYHLIIIKRKEPYNKCCFDFTDNEIKFFAVHGDWKEFIRFYAVDNVGNGFDDGVKVEEITEKTNKLGTKYIEVPVPHVFSSYAAAKFAVINLSQDSEIEEYLIVMTDKSGKYGTKEPNLFPTIFDSIIIH